MAKGYYDRGIDWPFWIAVSVAILLLGSLVTFLVYTIQESNAYEDQFTKQCNAAGGQPMFTRDADFCLNGNTILYVKN